jgi:hypothetical protein
MPGADAPDYLERETANVHALCVVGSTVYVAIDGEPRNGWRPWTP